LSAHGHHIRCSIRRASFCQSSGTINTTNFSACLSYLLSLFLSSSLSFKFSFFQVLVSFPLRSLSRASLAISLSLSLSCVYAYALNFFFTLAHSCLFLLPLRTLSCSLFLLSSCFFSLFRARCLVSLLATWHPDADRVWKLATHIVAIARRQNKLAAANSITFVYHSHSRFQSRNSYTFNPTFSLSLQHSAAYSVTWGFGTGNKNVAAG